MTNKHSDRSKAAEIDESIQKMYDIKRRVGKGAYGIVWKAIKRDTNTVVAVKKIFDAFRDETDAQRTFREISFLRSFGNHPNIIKLHNVYSAANNLDIYLSFEYMDSDLHNLIKKETILKDIHKRFIMYQILCAVKYLHSGNVIHRDLKPSNILLDAKCKCKLADFGLARSVAKYSTADKCDNDNMSEPMLTDYVATRWYRAPEILVASKKYTKGIDMWSLGCILGEMIRGKPLFQGSSTINQVEKIVSSLPQITQKDIDAIGPTFGSVLFNRQRSQERSPSLAELLANGPNDAIDLVQTLLVLDPLARLTAKKALHHPYVANKFRNAEMEAELKTDIVPSCRDDVRLTVGEYRQKLYEIIERPTSNKQDNKRHMFTNINEQFQSVRKAVSSNQIPKKIEPSSIHEKSVKPSICPKLFEAKVSNSLTCNSTDSMPPKKTSSDSMVLRKSLKGVDKGLQLLNKPINETISKVTASEPDNGDGLMENKSRRSLKYSDLLGLRRSSHPNSRLPIKNNSIPAAKIKISSNDDGMALRPQTELLKNGKEQKAAFQNSRNAHNSYAHEQKTTIAPIQCPERDKTSINRSVAALSNTFSSSGKQRSAIDFAAKQQSQQENLYNRQLPQSQKCYLSQENVSMLNSKLKEMLAEQTSCVGKSKSKCESFDHQFQLSQSKPTNLLAAVPKNILDLIKRQEPAFNSNALGSEKFLNKYLESKPFPQSNGCNQFIQHSIAADYKTKTFCLDKRLKSLEFEVNSIKNRMTDFCDYAKVDDTQLNGSNSASSTESKPDTVAPSPTSYQQNHSHATEYSHMHSSFLPLVEQFTDAPITSLTSQTKKASNLFKLQSKLLGEDMNYNVLGSSGSGGSGDHIGHYSHEIKACGAMHSQESPKNYIAPNISCKCRPLAKFI